MLPCSLPLKCAIVMAGSDIAMNAFQIVTDADYVYVEKGNSQGKIKKSDLISLLLNTREKFGILISNKSGSGLLKPNVGFVFAYDSTDTSKYLLYAYIRNSGEVANRIKIASNGIDLGEQNDQGTSVITSGDTQICIYIKK